jgi:hypothetical protein
MLSVREMFLKALSMKVNGSRPPEIREKLLDLGHANGFPQITEVGGDGHFELIFHKAGSIAFDGGEWHLHKA